MIIIIQRERYYMFLSTSSNDESFDALWHVPCTRQKVKFFFAHRLSNTVSFQLLHQKKTEFTIISYHIVYPKKPKIYMVLFVSNASNPQFTFTSQLKQILNDRKTMVKQSHWCWNEMHSINNDNINKYNLFDGHVLSIFFFISLLIMFQIDGLRDMGNYIIYRCDIVDSDSDSQQIWRYIIIII